MGFTCSSCTSSGQAAYSDGSACTYCDSTTSGLSSSLGDCSCATNSTKGYYTDALIDKDDVGNKLTNKTCSLCPDGDFVVVGSSITTGASSLPHPPTPPTLPSPEIFLHRIEL